MTATVAEVRFGRLERRGLLLGLTAAQLGLLGTALVVLVAGGMSTGPVGILFSAPVWLGAVLLALVQVGGRPVVESVPIALPWLARRVTHRQVALAGPSATSILSIPGVSERLRIVEVSGTSAAAIESARRVGGGPVTVVARARGRGFLLEGDAAQDRRVASWGRLLGSLCQLPHVSGVQVLHRTTTGGDEVRRWWADQRATSPWAASLMTDLAEDTADRSQVDTLVAISVRPRRGVEVATVVRSLGEALDGAEIAVENWVTSNQIRAAVRCAYDPTNRSTSVTAAAPMGVAEAWTHARSDSAFHATFWISEWPRSSTHPGFLRSLLLAPGAHRTFSVIAEPLPTGKALREIRRARAEQVADAATRARIGQVEDEATRAAADELTRREEDLIAGHGDLRFVGLISVTATTVDELEDACVALQSSAGQAGCELRRLVGQQVQAFAAAALPLARLLS